MLELALAAAIHTSNPRLPQETTRLYARKVMEESNRRKLDPWVFYAIIHVESRWISSVANWHEPNHSCSIGLGGILVSGCHRLLVQHLFNPVFNLHRSAEIQEGLMHYNHDPRRWLWNYNHSSRYVSLVLQVAREARR